MSTGRALLVIACLIALQSNLYADSIKLKNGDSLQGTIEKQSEQSIELTHDVLGTLTIPREQIAELQIDKPDDGEPEPEPAAERGLFNTGFLAGWSRGVTLGINGSEGVTQNTKIHLDFKGDYEDETDRWILATAYNWKTEDKKTTDNNFYISLDRDWLNPDSPWFWFARSRYDWDEFTEWDHRLGFFGGPGYQFIKNDTWNLRGRTGAGGKYTWGGSNSGFEAEALIGADLGWNISDSQSLKFKTTFYPSLERGGEFRNISSLDWKLDVSEFYRGIALKVGIDNEYDSQGLSEDSNYDFKYYFGIHAGL